jgi:hypothetical protein
MGRNRLTYFIDGREAVPIRAIPYVTGWMQSPDEIAGDLAKRVGAPFSVLRDVSAHHVHGRGHVTKVLPKEWDAVVTSLKALESRLKKTHGEGDEGYAVWRQESVKALPAGVFVWRDEFEAELRRRKMEGDVTLARPRPGDSDLNYEPMITPDVWTLVIEGFRTYQYAQQEVEKRAAGRYTLEEAAQLIAVGCGEAFESVLASLRASVLSGDLKTYNPGRALKVIYGKQSGQNSEVCDNYEEVVWSEVNEWITRNGLQGFRFPAPQPASASNQSKTPSDGESSEPKAWVIEARRIADTLALKRWSSGHREITARNICNAVADKLSSDGRYHGARGARTGNNVRNIALKGWK